MNTAETVTTEIMVLSNHIYEYQKGVRNLILYTVNERCVDKVCRKLERQKIDYLVQTVNGNNVNVFFGRPECLAAVKTFIGKPLYHLSPEEDFILGAMLGYDICRQCERFCEQKRYSESRTC